LTDEELIPFNSFKPAHLWINQDYEAPYLPTGFVFKLQLISNWGDQKTIGLNGIILYDQLNRVISDYVTPKVVSYPIAEDSNENNLNNIINNNKKVRSWSTDYINKNLSHSEGLQPVSLYFVFERPVTIAKMHFINYTINPLCGVKDFIIFCDDSIIYQVNFW